MIAPGQDCKVVAQRSGCWSALSRDPNQMPTFVEDVVHRGARATYVGPYEYKDMEGWHVLLVVAASGRPLYCPLRENQFVTRQGGEKK